MWEALVWTAIGVLIGLGVTMVSLTPAEYSIARISFSLAALILSGRLAWWLISKHYVNKTKTIILAVVIVGLIGGGWVVTMKWVAEREHQTPIVSKKQHNIPAKKFTEHQHSAVPAPILANIIVSEKQIVSVDRQFSYGLEIILQTDKSIEPVAFIIEFSEEIGKGSAEFVSSSLYVKSNRGIIENNNMLHFKWESPAFTPDRPIKITVFSKNYVKMVGYQMVPYTWP